MIRSSISKADLGNLEENGNLLIRDFAFTVFLKQTLVSVPKEED